MSCLLNKSHWIVALAALCVPSLAEAQQRRFVLQPAAFKHYVDRFNREDEELYVQHIPNAQAWPFLQANIPLF